jgi:hypothetical protein
VAVAPGIGSLTIPGQTLLAAVDLVTRRCQN